MGRFKNRRQAGEKKGRREKGGRKRGERKREGKEREVEKEKRKRATAERTQFFILNSPIRKLAPVTV